VVVGGGKILGLMERGRENLGGSSGNKNEKMGCYIGFCFEILKF
jgi:hypothetical protein